MDLVQRTVTYALEFSAERIVSRQHEFMYYIKVLHQYLGAKVGGFRGKNVFQPTIADSGIFKCTGWCNKVFMYCFRIHMVIIGGRCDSVTL